MTNLLIHISAAEPEERGERGDDDFGELVTAGTGARRPVTIHDSASCASKSGSSANFIATSRKRSSSPLSRYCRTIGIGSSRSTASSFGGGGARIAATAALATLASGAGATPRAKWNSRTEFLLATIGNCVGVGNVRPGA